MSFKKLFLVQIAISFVLGVAIGLIAISSDTEGSVNVVAVIPLGLILALIGYGGPVIIGAGIYRLLNRKSEGLSYRGYFTSYCLLVVAFILYLWSISDHVDSGFAIFMLPFLPAPALFIALVIRAIKLRLQPKT